jgi:hypothetical protein
MKYFLLKKLPLEMNLGNLRIMHEALLLVRVVNCVYTFRHTGDKLSVDMKTADATKAFV